MGNVGPVLVVCFLVFCVWYFGVLVFGLFGFLVLPRKTFFFKKPKAKYQTNKPKYQKHPNQNTKQQRNHNTEKPKNKISKNISKTGSTFSVELCFFGFWFWSSSGSTDTTGGLKLYLLPTLQKQTPHSRAESSQPPKSNPPFSSRKGRGALEDFPNRCRV